MSIPAIRARLPALLTAAPPAMPPMRVMASTEAAGPAATRSPTSSAAPAHDLPHTDGAPNDVRRGDFRDSNVRNSDTRHVNAELRDVRDRDVLHSDARHILVLRPNAIGDYMFALPALHALRDSYPDARITLLGKPWHAAFLHGRPGPVSDVIVMPPVPGIGAPPDGPMPEAARQLVAALRNMRVDLALQMYGGGTWSNAFVALLGAAVSLGATTPGAAALDRTIAYSRLANRRLELLQIAALAGARPSLVSPELEVTPEDRSLSSQALPHNNGARLVVIHPGASDPRRCWPPAGFAAVADALADAGAQIVISATEAEAGIARAVVRHMRHRPIDLTGRLPLPALCGLLDRAGMIVSNDTGPLHLALALGKPAVGVFWLTNLIESCPLAQHLLRPALSTRVHCPVCGEENLRTRCAHDASFVADVGRDEVIGLALELFRATR